MRHTRIFTFILMIGVIIPILVNNSVQGSPSTQRNLLHESSNEIELVSHLGGTTSSVYVQGEYAYLGIGPELAILDISDIHNPIRKGSYLFPNTVKDVYLFDDLAYIAVGVEGIWIIDVSNPKEPVMVGHTSKASFSRRIVVSNGYAYVASEGVGLSILDVSDPGFPVEVGILDTPGSAYSVAIKGSYAYIADLWEGLRIVDVSKPSNPIEIGYYDTPGFAYDVKIQDNWVYIADHDEVIRVLDVSYPNEPVLIGYYAAPGVARAIAVSGETIYLAAGDAGLRVIQFSIDSPPFEFGSINTTKSVSYVFNSGNLVFIIDESLRIIDVSNPYSIQEAGSYSTPKNPLSLAIDQVIVYAADGANGLQIVDSSLPYQPSLIATLDTTGFAQDIQILAEKIYLSDWNTLSIYDLSDSNNPEIIGVYENLHMAWNITLHEHYAYVAEDEYGVWIIDIADPSNPFMVGHYDSPGYAADIAVQGGYAYLADWFRGLRILNVADPSKPTEISHLETSGQALGIRVRDNYVYMVDGDNGFLIIDVSVPTNPKITASLDTPGKAEGLEVTDTYAYIADGESGVRVVDITNPALPVEVAHFDTPGYSEMVTLSNGFIYVADSWGGLFVLNQGEFNLSGQINQTNGIPATGIDIVTNLGQTAVTDNQGYYEFKNMIAGPHTITPTHPFHTFIPEYRNVILPPDVSSQNFTIIARPVSKIISPGNSSTLVYSDTQGLPTTLTLAPDSLSVTTTLYLTPTHLMAPTGYAFSGHALRISPNITFPSPVTLTINYSQNDIRLFHDLNELKILWQMNSDWQDAILSCSATRTITPQITAIADGMLSGTICQTGLFTFFGPTHQLFSPSPNKVFSMLQRFKSCGIAYDR